MNQTKTRNIMKTNIHKSIISAIVTVTFLAATIVVLYPAVPSLAPGVDTLKGNETPSQIQDVYSKAMADLVKGLAANDSATVRSFETTVHHAARPGAEPERKACCNVLANLLINNIANEAKLWILGSVQFACREEVVPALRKLLNDADANIRESARRALEHNPSQQALVALREALQSSTDPQFQAALALSVGIRKDIASVPTLAKIATSKNLLAAESALIALGKIADPASAKAIASIIDTLPEELRLTAGESYIKCAEQFLRAGNINEASAIYKKLNQPAQPRPIRLAALRGVLQTAGDDAGNMILDILSSQDYDAKTIAIAQTYELKAGALTRLLSGVSKLPVESQVLLIGIVADRNEKSAMPEAIRMLKSNDPALRSAGINALAKIGDATTVPLLISVLAEGGNIASEARSALTRLSGNNVNEQILSTLNETANPQVKTTLVEILEARGATVAVKTLLAFANGTDEPLRRASFRALSRLAMPSELPDLIKAFLKTKPGSERTEAEKTLAAVCARITPKEKQADPIISAYESGDDAAKNTLLPVLGRIGGQRAFEIIKAALASGDAARVSAAHQALFNWSEPTESVADELLSMVKNASKPADKIQALRAYIQVVTLPGGFPDKVQLDRLQQAMTLADRNDEKNLILERLTNIKRIETVKFVLPYLEDPALSTRAGTVIVELAKDVGLRSKYKNEFEQALNKIVSTSKDKNLIERAKRRLQGN